MVAAQRKKPPATEGLVIAGVNAAVETEAVAAIATVETVARIAAVTGSNPRRGPSALRAAYPWWIILALRSVSGRPHRR